MSSNRSEEKQIRKSKSLSPAKSPAKANKRKVLTSSDQEGLTNNYERWVGEAVSQAKS